MSSSETNNSNSKETHSYRTRDGSTIQTTTLTPFDRYTALRNHRIRFKDAMDPNAERVTSLRNQDVIFGRGKNMQDYPGNRRMRIIINKYKPCYHSIERCQKRNLIEAVYKEIIRGGSRFLTKATNDEHFVIVDIEVALQKVGNTLRCRKNRTPTEKGVNNNGEAAVSHEAAVSEHKVPVVATTMKTTTTTPSKISKAPEALNSSHTMNKLSHASPLLMLSQRTQTMSLLRENTLRLIQERPLRPATAVDVLYLQRCKSLYWDPYQLRPQPISNVLAKAGMPSYLQRTILPAAYMPSSCGVEIAGPGSCGQEENSKKRDST